MRSYKALNKQIYHEGNFSFLPLRFEDRLDIRKWRNEQIYHLRQNKPLTKEDQNRYFNEVVSTLFNQDQPDQILFSFLENDICIGYGGLVHINWTYKTAEISFIMNTELEETRFFEIWMTFLKLLEKVAFLDLKFQKIYTYAFDLRPDLFKMLLQAGYTEEVRLKEHCLFEGNYIDVLIHSKINYPVVLRKAAQNDIDLTFQWASNKTIRQYAIQKEEILFDNHKIWFLNKIDADRCFYFIAEVNGIPIGSIRFDINYDGSALISFLIDPDFQGKGYAKEIVKLGCDEIIKRDNITGFVAVVDLANVPSLKTFTGLGFNQVFKVDSFITFTKNTNALSPN